MRIEFEKWLLIIILWTVICPIQVIHAQIPHGGYPLAQDAEKSSRLRTAVDYFVDMPSFNLDSVLYIDNLSGNRTGGSLTFAHKFFVDLTPENSGIVFHTENGTKVWKVGIRSANAYTINVLFDEFYLPDGARVFLYNSDRSTIIGSFTNENRPEGGEFSVAPVDGEELTIEYQEPANAEFSGKIRISEVNHDYRGLFRAGTRFGLIDAPCLPSLSCDSIYSTIGQSVCLLIINGVTYCTGTLINNTKKDGTPYLITASHCFGGNQNANNLETRLELSTRVVAFLNYESPRCKKNIRGSDEFSVSGSISRAISPDIDFSLLELTEMPPSDYRPFLAGWSRDSTSSAGTPFTGIHHPYGEVKRYCVEQDPIIRENWIYGANIAPGNHWLVPHWEIGATWSGSSGSPIFDKYNRFRGGLTGGNSSCVEGENGDYYYRFDRAWDQYPNSEKQLKHWLDPLTPANLQSPTSLDGMDPYAENPAKRINNLTKSDSLGTIQLKAPRTGSIFGHNSLGITYFAEHFSAVEPSMIQGVYLMTAQGELNKDTPVTIRVYEGGNRPGSILGKAVLNPSYLDYSNGALVVKEKQHFFNRENYVRFETPISVSTDFYVGYEITYPESAVADTFNLMGAIRETAKNTAYFKRNGFWYPYTKLTSQPVYTSLWIEPVIAGDTITTPNPYFEEDTTTVNSDVPIIAYSFDESTFYIALPEDWDGTTEVELFDFNGIKIKETTIYPPISSFLFPANQERFLLIRLKNKDKIYVTKIGLLK